MALGAASWFNGVAAGKYVVFAGLLRAVSTCWSAGSAPSRTSPKAAGTTSRSTLSFRWGMSWFIFSEVMFFAAFFGALFYMRVHVGAWISAASKASS